MTRDILINEYFDWMYDTVCGGRAHKRKSYRKLLSHLYDTDFTFTLEMDGNRADDGIDLRYQFGRDYRYDDAMIAAYLDDKPCSVLEMIVALVLRCEDHIMYGLSTDNGASELFWTMMENLGLNTMDDRKYDKEYVGEVLDIFLDRRYKRNGEGGLFVIHRGNRDMRTADIWYQMNWYLDEIVNN